MLNKIKSLFKKKESKPISEYEQYIIDVLLTQNEDKTDNVSSILNEYTTLSEEVKEIERLEKLWKEAEETIFYMVRIKRASEKVYEKILITEKMYKDSLYGNK
jgi:histidinol-phosphate/aromatic aminotransferase/cobyric acid decarboxylase-like protein